MRIHNIIAISVLIALALVVYSAKKDKPLPAEIQLLIRADDIGSSHAANRACIEVYKNGIARSVEVMVNCAWFPQAAQLLRENPGYDVGVHLMLTSEWDLVKWRPLTHAPSLVDSNGYFFPMIWANENFPAHRTLSNSSWDIEEIEQELRAQIQLAMKHIPHVSHISTHMGFNGMDPKVDELIISLGKEYNLYIDLAAHDFKRMPGWKNNQSLDEKIETFARNLASLDKGNYLFVEHPAYDEPEMQATFHTGYTHVARDREEVTRILTSEKVKKVIRERGIKLVSYNDFR
jgi:chitin disaccharide deacetylase